MPSSPFGPCRSGTEANRKEKRRRIQACWIDRPRAGHHPVGKPADALICYEIIFSTGITDPARHGGSPNSPTTHGSAYRAVPSSTSRRPGCARRNRDFPSSAWPTRASAASSFPSAGWWRACRSAKAASSISPRLPASNTPRHGSATATGHCWSSCCLVRHSSPPP